VQKTDWSVLLGVLINFNYFIKICSKIDWWKNVLVWLRMNM